MRRTVPGTALLATMTILVVTAVAALAADDPYGPQQWGLDRIGAPTAWAATTGEGVVVAIVDTGVDLEHPDLADRFLRDEEGRVVGRDFVDDDDDPQDEEGHGTMVAGIAAATGDNGEGIAGVAPLARLMPVRVLDRDGAGRYADLDAGIRWAVDAGADVINLSLERAEEPDTLGRTLGALSTPVSAVQYAWDHGVVVVAAAGNSGGDTADYPEDSPVLLVGASDRDDRRAGFSDAGRSDVVLAPGVEIVSTWCDARGDGCDPSRRYGVASGTSFAAPSVTGAVALLRALGLNHRDAVERIRATAVDLGAPGADADTGVGRLDVAAAVAVDEDPTSPASPSPGTVASGDGVAAVDEGPSATAAPSPTPPGEGAADPAGPSPAPEPDPAPTRPAAAAPATPSDPSPVAAPPAVPGSQRAAWLGLAAVLLFVTASSVAINLYRHGGAGFSGAGTWGRPSR